MYPDRMVEHDGHVGLLLNKLDELGIKDNTMVMYSTDNGAETFTWPVVINLRADPYEIMWQESQMYMRWMADNMWTFVPAQQYVAQFLNTFKDFPPRMGSSLSVDMVLKQLLVQGRPK